MSKAAKALMRELNILDFTSDEPKIDAAVAPLVEASTSLRTEIVRFFGTDDATTDGLNNAIRALNEALEPWRQK